MVCCLLLAPAYTQAQDIIVKKDGSRIQSKVLEISNDEVLYKEWNNQQGETFAVETDELFRVEFQNGEKEIFSEEKKGAAVEQKKPDKQSVVVAEKESQQTIGNTVNSANELPDNPNVLQIPTQKPESNLVKDAWFNDKSTVLGVGYGASFDYADKGDLGYEMHAFGFGNSAIGMSMHMSGIYNLASEKFFDNFSLGLGPNVCLPITPNFAFLTPLYLTMTSVDEPKYEDGKITTSTKLQWGASLVPSLAFKAGSFFLSAGLFISKAFVSESKITANAFMITIGFMKEI